MYYDKCDMKINRSDITSIVWSQKQLIKTLITSGSIFILSKSVFETIRQRNYLKTCTIVVLYMLRGNIYIQAFLIFVIVFKTAFHLLKTRSFPELLGMVYVTSVAIRAIFEKIKTGNIWANKAITGSGMFIKINYMVLAITHLSQLHSLSSVFFGMMSVVSALYQDRLHHDSIGYALALIPKTSAYLLAASICFDSYLYTVFPFRGYVSESNYFIRYDLMNLLYEEKQILSDLILGLYL